MRAVEFHEYGPARDVIRIVEVARPEPGPGQLLVRVIASSVNPIDCAIRGGYGQSFFASKGWADLPIRLGRDAAGIVEAVGDKVRRFKTGDAVYAAVLNTASADYVLVDEDHAAMKPRNLSFAEAASIPYVALTTWSALIDHVGLTPETTGGKKVVIPRGAGGVGSFAIQLMKAWGATVASICSTRNLDLVRSLGADIVVDYTREDFTDLLHEFDVAYDTAFDTEEKLLGTLKTHADAAYVSIVTPKLVMIDEYGLEEGLRRVDALFDARVREQAQLGRRYYWSFMEPNGVALEIIAALVEANKIRPVIDRIYKLDEMVEAHEYCETKQAQGKIVIEIAPEQQGKQS